MIIVKIVNQRVVHIALSPSNRKLTKLLDKTHQHQQIAIFARTLIQSAAQSQKVRFALTRVHQSFRCRHISNHIFSHLQVTSANNQQLIPVARNISFRQCQRADIRQPGPENAKASFSMASNSHGSTSHFLSADLEPYIVIGEQEAALEEQRESPLEVLKRKAKDARDKRELANKNKYYGQIFNEALPASTSERRLVVLLSWLEAKEKHIEKYRQFYLARGFDVLNVKTSPWDLLLPNHGARKISEDFVRFMVEKEYSNVLVHGFSVGGYMFGRFLLEIDRHDEQMRNRLLNSIRGLVFDSLVPFEGTCYGVANSITLNPMAAKVIEQILRFYLAVGHKIATKYYLEASEKVWGGPLKCPSLFLMSKDDKISDHRTVERLAGVWSDLGIDVQKMVVDSSPHVQLFSRHHEQYKQRVGEFLKYIKLGD